MKTIKELLVEKHTEKLIRKKYSLNDELKMARKSHDTEEFFAFNTYVEECILKAKEDVEKQFAESNKKIKGNPLLNKLLAKTFETVVD